MRRWQLLSPNDSPLPLMHSYPRHEVLDAVEAHLDSLPVEL